jgi:hypothetical protein
VKQLLIFTFISFFSILTFAQSDGTDNQRCSVEKNVYDNCWSIIEYSNGQRYVGMIVSGKPQGEGILYFSDGVIREQGQWKNGEHIEYSLVSKNKFPFNDAISKQNSRALEIDRERRIAEIERNRPPEQRIAFCVQTIRSSGSRHPSISLPYCQEACDKTYADRMCSEVGGTKWRIQTASPKTSPPSSQFFSGLGSCACIGQEYVLNEIKETIPAPPSPQLDSREAELAKREKALAEREKALLEAEIKRLRDELEAEYKKKK